MRTVSIDFYSDNKELLIDGLKTTTLRTDKQALKIGMEINETCLVEIVGIDRVAKFKVTYLGLLHIDECGGKETVCKTEGFSHTDTGKPKFSSTVDFLEGKRKLHVYSFSRMSITQLVR